MTIFEEAEFSPYELGFGHALAGVLAAFDITDPRDPHEIAEEFVIDEFFSDEDLPEQVAEVLATIIENVKSLIAISLMVQFGMQEALGAEQHDHLFDS